VLFTDLLCGKVINYGAGKNALLRHRRAGVGFVLGGLTHPVIMPHGEMFLQTATTVSRIVPRIGSRLLRASPTGQRGNQLWLTSVDPQSATEGESWPRVIGQTAT